MKKSTSAFSLIEVTIALGIAAFSLVSILGLLPVGLNSSANASRQTVAVNILSSVTADLRVTPVTSTTSAHYGIPIAAGATIYFNGNGKYSNTQQTDSLYSVAVTSQSPGGRRATWARVRIWWPAVGNGMNPQGMVETSISLDRN